MKSKLFTTLAVAIAAALITTYAQSGPVSGTYTTTLTWGPYPATNESDGLQIVIGTAPGVWSSTNSVVDTATTFTFQGGLPGQVYHSGIRAYASDGRLGPMSMTSWTNPMALPAVSGFKPSVIVYVP